MAGLFVLGPSPFAQTLDVAEVLQQQRWLARTAHLLDSLGTELTPRPIVRLGQPGDVERAWTAILDARKARRDSLELARRDSLARVAATAPLPEIVWRNTDPEAQGGYLEQYREVYWKAMSARSPIDTMATPVLRGRLQAAFGKPTRNADALKKVGYSGSEYVQFEYWLVVNDSIPILAMDIDGPFGRGLLVAGPEAYDRYLPQIKRDLGERLIARRFSDPYVDYYLSYERNRWYRTGYNGAEYFQRTVRRPPGWSRRPQVERWVIHR
ncbi:MAG: hypothetical protein AAF170_05950 [Bacteroidota bacterium]